MQTIKVNTDIDWCDWGSTYDRLLAANEWDKGELEALKAHRNIIDSAKDPEEILRVIRDCPNDSDTMDICVDYALLGPEHMTFDLSSGKKYGYEDNTIGVFFGSREFPLEPLDISNIADVHCTKLDETHNCSAVRWIMFDTLSYFLTNEEQDAASFYMWSQHGWEFEDFRNFNHALAGDPYEFYSSTWHRNRKLNGEYYIGEERGREIARGIVEYRFDFENKHAYSKTVSYNWRNYKLRATLLNIIDKGIFYSFADKQNTLETAGLVK